MRTSRSGPKPPMQSLIPILEVLDTEGFTEYSAQLVQRYNRKKAKQHSSRMDAYEKKKTRLSKVMQKLNDGERLIVGKFFAQREAMALDAGLRIGLTARVVLDEPEMER